MEDVERRREEEKRGRERLLKDGGARAGSGAVADGDVERRGQSRSKLVMWQSSVESVAVVNRIRGSHRLNRWQEASHG